MWIAKPFEALSSAEREDWIRCVREHQERDPDIPLAQAYSWAGAIAASGFKAHLVFSPAEGVGGVVFCMSAREGGGIDFECVNGPLLDWDDAANVPRQLAVFSAAVSRLSPAFGSLTMRPRWSFESTPARLKALPIMPQSFSDAATLIIRLSDSDRAQFDSFSPRLQRTIRKTMEAGGDSTWEEIGEIGEARAFVEKMRSFGSEKGFFVPSFEWFGGLIGDASRRERQRLRFWLATASAGDTGGDGASASILVATFGNRAHYLFGHQQRGASLPGAISPSALAQFRAMRECAGFGVTEYDMNGLLADPEPGHPYARVCEFKTQFGGSVVRYRVPEFVITP